MNKLLTGLVILGFVLGFSLSTPALAERDGAPNSSSDGAQSGDNAHGKNDNADRNASGKPDPKPSKGNDSTCCTDGGEE